MDICFSRRYLQINGLSLASNDVCSTQTWSSGRHDRPKRLQIYSRNIPNGLCSKSNVHSLLIHVFLDVCLWRSAGSKHWHRQSYRGYRSKSTHWTGPDESLYFDLKLKNRVWLIDSSSPCTGDPSRGAIRFRRRPHFPHSTWPIKGKSATDIFVLERRQKARQRFRWWWRSWGWSGGSGWWGRWFVSCIFNKSWSHAFFARQDNCKGAEDHN